MAAKSAVAPAKLEAIFRGIPTVHETLEVTSSNATLDLSAYGAGPTDLRGHWVFFTARGGNVTLRLFDSAAPTLVAGTGFTIAAGATQELFVDPDGFTNLRAIGSVASCQLDADF